MPVDTGLVRAVAEVRQRGHGDLRNARGSADASLAAIAHERDACRLLRAGSARAGQARLVEAHVLHDHTLHAFDATHAIECRLAPHPLTRTLADSMRIFAPAIVLAAAGFLVARQFVDPAPPQRFTIATAGADGAYHALAMRYRSVLARHGIARGRLDAP